MNTRSILRSLATTLGLTLLASVTACSVDVAHNLDEGEANRMVVALSDAQIAASKGLDPAVENRFVVQVAQAELASALSALAAAGLPGERNPGVLDALGEAGLVASPSSEHARRVMGTAGELERSLSSLDGVLSARVHLAIAEREPLAPEERPVRASASVLLRHRGTTPPLSASEIARLVSGAVQGLAPEAVVVVLHAVPMPAHSDQAGLAALGPFTVSRNSLPILRLVLAIAVTLNIALLSAVGWLWLRVRATKTDTGNVSGAA